MSAVHGTLDPLPNSRGLYAKPKLVIHLIW
jgi:hypothetical protein